jgi:hypothetical protein
MKLTAIEKARAELLFDNIREFRNWPQSLGEMERDWQRGFTFGRGREREVKRALNYLAETGRIKFVTIDNGPNRGREIGFVLGEQEKEEI